MPRNPKPLQLVQGHITKDQKRERQEKENKMNSRLKRDDIIPPKWLDANGKKMFAYLVEQFDGTDMLTNLDVTALATYCDLHSRRLKLMKDVRKNGATLTNENSRGGVTYITNPSLTALNNTIKLLQTYEDRFGLHLVGRTRIALKDDEKPTEKDSFSERFGV